MINVSEANRLISCVGSLTQVTNKKLNTSQGYFTCNSIESPVDLPLFDQSAMDGYALNAGSGLQNPGASFKIIGEVAAGDAHDPKLAQGQGVKIFTGAPVPADATTVVQKEWVAIADGSIVLEREVKVGANIRRKGEQVRMGDEALKAGTRISAGTIGYLSMMGIEEVEVYEKPTVHLMVTGDELKPVGAVLERGQIYESNAAMISSLLKMEGIQVEVFKLRDDPAATREAIYRSLSACDMIIISGGISVGDHDYVLESLQANGVNTVFYKVRQKPGKPLFFGTLGEKAVFALPGNPQSALVCYYMYVLNVLRKMQGSDVGLLHFQAPLSAPIYIKGDRDEFLPAIFENGRVTPLPGDNSGMLRSYAIANAIVYIPGDSGQLKPGQRCLTYLLM